MRSVVILVAATAAMQRVEGGGVILASPTVVVSAEGTETDVSRDAHRFDWRTFASQAMLIARVPVFPNAENKTRGQALCGYQEDQQADEQI